MDKNLVKKEAKEIVKKDFALIWLALGINFGLSIIYSYLFEHVLVDFEYLNLISVGFNLLTIPFSYGLTKYLLNIARGQKSKIKDLFYYYYHNPIQILLLSLLLSLLYSLGFILYIIPAIFLYFMFCMAENIIVEKNNNFIDALKESYNLMQGYKWDYFNFLLTFFPWLLLGIATLGIGFIWVLPYFTLSQKLYYFKLKEIKNPPKKRGKKGKNK